MLGGCFFTQKLEFLCNVPEKVVAIKEGAADYICNKYNWDDVVTATLRLYGVTENGDTAVYSEKEYNESSVNK